MFLRVLDFLTSQGGKFSLQAPLWQNTILVIHALGTTSGLVLGKDDYIYTIVHKMTNI